MPFLWLFPTTRSGFIFSNSQQKDVRPLEVGSLRRDRGWTLPAPCGDWRVHSSLRSSGQPVTRLHHGGAGRCRTPLLTMKAVLSVCHCPPVRKGGTHGIRQSQRNALCVCTWVPVFISWLLLRTLHSVQQAPSRCWGSKGPCPRRVPRFSLPLSKGRMGMDLCKDSHP